MSSLRELARRNRLKYRRGEDGEVIIPGRKGHVGVWSNEMLYWCLTYDYEMEAPTARYKLLAMRDPLLNLVSEADEEGVFSFAPEDLLHIATKWCKARIRRRANPTDLANLSRARMAPTGRVSAG